MDSNIDLTDKRDFRDSEFNNGLDIFRKKVQKISLNSLRQRLISVSEIISNNNWEIYDAPAEEHFFTGNKQEILQKEYYRELRKLDLCDRCGKKLKILPWEKQDSLLCDECNKELEKEMRRERTITFPWNRNIRRLI